MASNTSAFDAESRPDTLMLNATAVRYVEKVTGHNIPGHNVTGHSVTGHSVIGYNVTGHNVTGHDITGLNVTGLNVASAEDDVKPSISEMQLMKVIVLVAVIGVLLISTCKLIFKTFSKYSASKRDLAA